VIYTIADSHLIIQFLEVLANISGSNWFRVLVVGIMLISLAWVLMVVAFFPGRWEQFKLWTFSMLLIFTMLLTATMSVNVYENVIWKHQNVTRNASLPVDTVNNVPLAVGIFGTLSSVAGSALSAALENFIISTKPSNVEKTFHPRLSEDTYLGKLKVLAELSQMRILRPHISNSITSFLQNCYFPVLEQNSRLLDRMEKTSDFLLFHELKTLAIRNGAVVDSRYSIFNPQGIPTDYQCNNTAGHDELDLLFREEVESAKYILTVNALASVGYDFSSIPGRLERLDQAQIDLFIEEQLLHAYYYYTNAFSARPARDSNLWQRIDLPDERANLVIRNQMLFNQIKDVAFQSLSPANTPVQKSVFSSESTLSWALTIKSFVYVVFLGIAPIIFLLMLSPIGVAVLRNFIFILLWMECWNPVMVVLNEIFSEQARAKIEALNQSVFQRLGPNSGEPLNFHITLSKQDEIFDLALQTLEIGNLVAVIAPFGLLFFVFGAGKVAGLIGGSSAKTSVAADNPQNRPAPFSRSSRY